MEVRRRRGGEPAGDGQPVQGRAAPVAAPSGCPSVGVVAAAVLLRVVCFRFGGALSRPETETALVSRSAVLDATAMKRDGVDIYDGDSVHVLPIWISLYSLLGDCECVALAVNSVADVAAGWLLCASAAAFASEKGRSSESGEWSSVAAACYLLNPATAAATAILSLSPLHNLCLALFVYGFAKKSLMLSVVGVAAAAHCSIYPVVLVGCVLIRFPDRRVLGVVGCGAGVGALVGVNWALAAFDTAFIDKTYGFILRIEDLTPNAGLFWYFFTQVFDHFRDFYLSVFQVNLLVYVLPLSLSIRHDEHLHMLMMLILVCVFSPYESIQDSAVYLALVPSVCGEELRKRMRYMLPIGATLVTTVVLMPVMWHMWIESGSGNANFYFGVTLFYNLAQIYLIMDLMFAYHRSRAETNYGIEINQDTKFALHDVWQ